MNYLKDVVEYFTPVLKTSNFYEKGVLTPEEFVLAGDQLVFKCKTWNWSSGDPKLRQPFLPAGKQFLITRNVPSLKRAHTYSMADAKELVVEKASKASEFGEEGWSLTHSHEDQKSEIAEDAELNVKPITKKISLPIKSAKPTDDVPDMEEFEEDNLDSQIDDATLEDEGTKDPQYLKAVEPEDNIVKTRTYDLSITYDKYYQTPRVFLFGYDEHRQPLTTDRVMEDISVDHVNKTVTVLPHPHLGVEHASIHPCQHAHVMKKIIDRLAIREAEEARKEAEKEKPQRGQKDDNKTAAPTTSKNPMKSKIVVEQYMILFLKFISSVIPTIEYDYTLSMET